MLSSLFVGIDVSAKDNKVQLLKSDGSEVLKFSVPNSLPGAKILSDKVVSTASNGHYEALVVGLEATSVYGDHLVYFIKKKMLP